MKRVFFLLIAMLFVLSLNGLSWAQDDTSVVDLSDRESDVPSIPEEDEVIEEEDVVYSPSLENTTPAGWAPGGPIEEE